VRLRDVIMRKKVSRMTDVPGERPAEELKTGDEKTPFTHKMPKLRNGFIEKNISAMADVNFSLDADDLTLANCNIGDLDAAGSPDGEDIDLTGYANDLTLSNSDITDIEKTPFSDNDAELLDYTDDLTLNNHDITDLISVLGEKETLVSAFTEAMNMGNYTDDLTLSPQDIGDLNGDNAYSEPGGSRASLIVIGSQGLPTPVQFVEKVAEPRLYADHITPGLQTDISRDDVLNGADDFSETDTDADFSMGLPSLSKEKESSLSDTESGISLSPETLLRELEENFAQDTRKSDISGKDRLTNPDFFYENEETINLSLHNDYILPEDSGETIELSELFDVLSETDGDDDRIWDALSDEDSSGQFIELTELVKEEETADENFLVEDVLSSDNSSSIIELTELVSDPSKEDEETLKVPENDNTLSENTDANLGTGNSENRADDSGEKIFLHHALSSEKGEICLPPESEDPEDKEFDEMIGKILNPGHGVSEIASDEDLLYADENFSELIFDLAEEENGDMLLFADMEENSSGEDGIPNHETDSPDVSALTESPGFGEDEIPNHETDVPDVSALTESIHAPLPADMPGLSENTDRPAHGGIAQLLERVMMKAFSEKIDLLINEEKIVGMVRKAIEREIDRLPRSLSEYSET